MEEISLPDDAITKARNLAGADQDPAAVIVEALDRLAWERREVAAVMEGVRAYEQGDYKTIEEFGQELQERYGLQLPEA